MGSVEVYLYELRFQDGTGSKIRPICVVVREEDAAVFGIYSYRSWFDSNDEFCEIQDIITAGLNRRSFVKVSDAVFVDDIEFDKAQRIGQLSPRDIKALEEAIDKHYE